MPRRPAIRSKHVDIAAANTDLLDRLPNALNAIENGLEASAICWACGLGEGKFKPFRCHVIAARDGGPDEPSNFFLLCDSCHKEQPDALPRAAQEEWLATHDNSFAAVIRRYGTIAAMLAADLEGMMTEAELKAFSDDVAPVIHSAETMRFCAQATTNQGAVYTLTWKIREFAKDWIQRAALTR